MRKPWRSFVLFLALGVIGAAMAIPIGIHTITASLEAAGIDEALRMSRTAMALLTMINPVLLVLVSTTIGHLLAHACGFRSLLFIHDKYQAPVKDQWIPSLKWGLSAGILLGLILTGADLLFSPFVPKELSLIDQQFSWYTFAVSVVYGGIVEEIMMRWGLMSLLAWAGWKLANRKSEAPGTVIVLASIIISSFLFGLSHYGVTSAAAEMTASVFTRMIILNGTGGVLFGLLYWKKNLETAMFAHIGTHLVLNLVYFF